MDPFDAQQMVQACDAPETDGLWSAVARQHLAYQPGGVVDVGISGAPPALAAIRQGTQSAKTGVDPGALIMWARFFGVRSGDKLHLRLIGPEGEVFRNSTEMTRNRAEEMRYAGQRSTAGWPKGRYNAVATIIRSGKPFDRLSQEFTLN